MSEARAKAMISGASAHETCLSVLLGVEYHLTFANVFSVP